MNITDVGHLVSDADTGEDKMEKGSRRTGKTAWEIAELYTAAFREDLRRLNALEPHIWCKATDHIPEQIAFVRCIEEKGFSYTTADGVYFDTSLMPDYGSSADWSGAKAQFEDSLRLSESPEAHDGLGIALWWLNEIAAAHRHRTIAYKSYRQEGELPQAAVIASWLAREQVFLYGNPAAPRRSDRRRA